jgi:hypothetical protein
MRLVDRTLFELRANPRHEHARFKPAWDELAACNDVTLDARPAKRHKQLAHLRR